MDGLFVVDTTLRDGEQMPGVYISPEDKLALAHRILDFGVDILECMPMASDEDAVFTKKLVSEGFGRRLRALCRPHKHDLSIARSCNVRKILLVFPVSDIHIRSKMKVDRETNMERMMEWIDRALGMGFEVHFAAEDASRADPSYLDGIMGALPGKVKFFLFGDTLGLLDPIRTSTIVKEIKKRHPHIKLEWHAHNDFGMAVANTVSAISSGADGFSATFCGIGERAGNAAMEEVLLAIKHMMGLRLPIRYERINEICKQLCDAASLTLSPNKPFVGENAFTHESGVHIAAVLNDPSTYEAIEPVSIGASRRFLFGKFVGRHALSHLLKRNGLSFTEEQLLLFREMVRGRAREEKRSLRDEEVIALFKEVLGWDS